MAAPSKLKAVEPLPGWDGSPIRPTIATVDLAALAANFRLLATAARPASVLAVVKADAYGHGAVACSRVLVREGAAFLGVALLEEAMVLREAGIAAPILILGGVYGDRYDLVVAHALTPVVFRAEQLEALAAAARAQGRPAVAHVKLDTGMGRIGVLPEELDAFAALARSLGVELAGLASHFAAAESDPGATSVQLERFRAGAALLAAAGHRLRHLHIANSAATLWRPDSAGTLVRPGVAIYGISPTEAAPPGPALRPVLSLGTEVVHLKELPAGVAVSYGARFVTSRPSRIATLPIGYGDGYDRAHTAGGCVLVRGRRAPIAGTVCMDAVMVDVTDVPGVQVGDEVVLLGRQGAEEISAGELAARCSTIPYETLCKLGPRVPRRHVGG